MTRTSDRIVRDDEVIVEGLGRRAPLVETLD
jgi:hypothetical protein